MSGHEVLTLARLIPRYGAAPVPAPEHPLMTCPSAQIADLQRRLEVERTTSAGALSRAAQSEAACSELRLRVTDLEAYVRLLQAEHRSLARSVGLRLVLVAAASVMLTGATALAL